MKQITEDYCSFEIAKLLKEKGFPQDYDKYHGLVYNEEDYEDEYEIQRMVLETRQVKAGTLHSYPLGVPEPKCYCSTQSLVLKWLREVHNIHISLFATMYLPPEEGCVPEKIIYTYNILNGNEPFHLFDEYDDCIIDNPQFNHYEQAVEAALKYTLENLI